MRIVVADRNPFFLEGFIKLIAAVDALDVVATCQDNDHCVRVIKQHSPDLILIDAVHSGISGSDVLAATKDTALSTRVVFYALSIELRNFIIGSDTGVSVSIEATLVRYLRRIIQTLRPTHRGDHLNRDRATPPLNGAPREPRSPLTERERQITHMVSAGLSNKEVGRRLNVSEGTVKIHLHHIYHKLSIGNRASLATWAAVHSLNS